MSVGAGETSLLFNVKREQSHFASQVLSIWKWFIAGVSRRNVNEIESRLKTCLDYIHIL